MISMLIHSRIVLLFLVLTLSPLFADAKVTTPSSTSLYNQSDGVLNLDHSDFASSVFGKTNAFLVKFYANWCGHCITFASRYKMLARDVINWRSVVRLAAVNCADTVNLNLCRDQSVTSYPTLKFYDPFSESGALGREFFLMDYTTNSMRKSVLHAITEYIRSIDPKERDEKLGSWPQLMPFNVSSQSQVIQNLELPYEAKPVLMVIEGPPATSAEVGVEVCCLLSF
jgi:thiol-disulfide isomerase/thioredoxin